MDKEYIDRLEGMLADAKQKLTDTANIQDPQQRDAMRIMFNESIVEIQEMLKKSGVKTKKAPVKKAAKKATKKPVTKKPAKKPAAKKPAKKAAKPVAKAKPKKATKPVVKKAAAKKVVKKTTKKAAKPVTKKAPVKKAAKPVSKKPTKKPVAKKAVKKSTVKKSVSKPVAKKPAVTVKPQPVVIEKEVIAKPVEVSKPVEPKKVIKAETKVEKKIEKVEKKEITVDKKEAKLAKKLAKKEAKEYKKAAKRAAKAIEKPAKVKGYEIPAYSDEIISLRKVSSLPEFGSAHKPMTDDELARNTMYSSIFFIDDKKPEVIVAKSVPAYKDEVKVSLKPYKDSKKTPTAKVGVAAGPLENGKVEIQKSVSDQPKVEVKKPEPKKAKESSKDKSANDDVVMFNDDDKKSFKKESKVIAKDEKKIEKHTAKDAKKVFDKKEFEEPKEDKETLKAQEKATAELKAKQAADAKAEAEAAKKAVKEEKLKEKEAAKAAKQKAKADAKAAKEQAKLEAKAKAEENKKEKEVKEMPKAEPKNTKKAKVAAAKPIADTKSIKEQEKEQAKAEKAREKAIKLQKKEEERMAKTQERDLKTRQAEQQRLDEEKDLREAKAKSETIASKNLKAAKGTKEKEAEINKLASDASDKAARQQKADVRKEKEDAKKAREDHKADVQETKADKKRMSAEDKRIAEQASKRAEIKKGEFIKVDLPPIPDDGVKSLKAIAKRQKQLTAKYSKQILEGAIVTTTDYKPEVSKHVIELHNVVKSYITGDIETPVLKGVDLKLNRGDFIVILGPSGSGKTTFLNTISGLDKATKGDVFVLGYNLSYLKDSHLTKFRRKHVGFIFQQYNLLTNLTAKENAEVGENLATNKNKDMTIEDIFETIGMKSQMNKYPHQMSGGQQQRVSIARALAKNPDILFADEPTGALDEEMGRKVLEILVEVNKRYGTTVIVVTHNPNIAKIGNTVIHIRNGRVDEVEKNQKPQDPSTIEWA